MNRIPCVCLYTGEARCQGKNWKQRFRREMTKAMALLSSVSQSMRGRILGETRYAVVIHEAIEEKMGLSREDTKVATAMK